MNRDDARRRPTGGPRNDGGLSQLATLVRGMIDLAQAEGRKDVLECMFAAGTNARNAVKDDTVPTATATAGSTTTEPADDSATTKTDEAATDASANATTDDATDGTTTDNSDADADADATTTTRTSRRNGRRG